MNNTDFSFLPGDLVRFKAYEHEHGATEITIRQDNLKTVIKSGDTCMAPPVMVVIEAVHNEAQFNESDGLRQHSASKVLCQWFSYDRCEFQERWFDTRLLVANIEKNKIDELKKENFLFNLCVTLKTALLANRQTREDIDLGTTSLNKGQTEKGYNITRIFDNLNYLPPKMLVTDVCDRNPSPLLFDNKKGEIRRKVSKWTVKCMWYDYKTGKYSEHHFAPESLIKTEELPNFEPDAWLNQIKPDSVSNFTSLIPPLTIET